MYNQSSEPRRPLHHDLNGIKMIHILHVVWTKATYTTCQHVLQHYCHVLLLPWNVFQQQQGRRLWPWTACVGRSKGSRGHIFFIKVIHFDPMSPPAEHSLKPPPPSVTHTHTHTHPPRLTAPYSQSHTHLHPQTGPRTKCTLFSSSDNIYGYIFLFITFYSVLLCTVYFYSILL